MRISEQLSVRYKGVSMTNNNGFWIWLLGLLALPTITVDYNSSHIELQRRLSLSCVRVWVTYYDQWSKHPSGTYDESFITVRQLRVCWCGTLSLTRERVCRLQLLLALASAVIFGCESHGTRDHILLSQIGDFPSRRLLRLARLISQDASRPA
jgi:hypothetical protein